MRALAMQAGFFTPVRVSPLYVARVGPTPFLALALESSYLCIFSHTAMVGLILFTFLLVFLNGFFVAAEFAIVKVRASQLEVKAKGGHRLAILSRHIS
jgi:hypothetical protein